MYLSFQTIVPLNIVVVGARSTWEKHGAFLNSFHPDVKHLIRRLEWINYRISRSEVSVVFSQTCLKEKTLHIYIYIYIHVYWLSNNQNNIFKEHILLDIDLKTLSGRILDWRLSQLGNKRKRKKAYYLFIHQRCCLSLLYSTTCIDVHTQTSFHSRFGCE